MTDTTQTMIGAGSKRVSIPAWTLDAALLAVAVAVAASLLFEGGLEALIGVGTGTVAGVLNERRSGSYVASAISGAFAGLFGGALIAGFFHPLFAMLVSQLL